RPRPLAAGGAVERPLPLPGPPGHPRGEGARAGRGGGGRGPARRQAGPGRAGPAGAGEEAAELLHAAIDHAHDFTGGAGDAIPDPLACVKVPELPAFATDHIDKCEQAALAAELIDWLLTGNRDGALLRRKALSVEGGRDYRKAKRDLRQARAKRKAHHGRSPDQDDRKAMSIWEREDAKLAKRIEELEDKIKQADRDRAKRRTVLQQLDAEAGRARIRKF